jgi:peptidoglycan-associated lipoprotein
MRALAVLAVIPLLVACASAKPKIMVGGLPADNDISGHWSGSWIGAGLFQAIRQESLTLDVTQRGNAGYGKVVLDGTVAAESIPWEVRQQGLGGIRVFATVSGSKVKLVHEIDDRIFSADMTVDGDQMMGQVNGRRVRLVLARQTPSPQSSQQSAKAAPMQMPPQVPVAAEPVPAQPEQGLATVAVAPPQEESAADKPKSEEEAQRPRSEDYVAVPELKPVYFDFDKAVLRPDAVDALTNNTAWLKENADALVLIEGNCDERGTAEYNLALGDRRAKSTMEYLEANGIPKERLSTISYGKERPVCTADTEECKNQNRRADFRIKSR